VNFRVTSRLAENRQPPGADNRTWRAVHATVSPTGREKAGGNLWALF
jgi:hypothetical protein